MFMFDSLAKNTLVPLLLRFGLAVIFIYHGIDKVGGEKHEIGAAWARGMGDKAPSPVEQLAVAWGELVGGLALAAGFLTRLAAAGISIIMLGAIATVHWPNGFSLQHQGYEYNFAILVMCAALIITGGGNFAVDRIFRLRRQPITV